MSEERDLKECFIYGYDILFSTFPSLYILQPSTVVFLQDEYDLNHVYYVIFWGCSYENAPLPYPVLETGTFPISVTVCTIVGGREKNNLK